VAFLSAPFSPAQTTKPVITLEPQPAGSGAMASYVKGEPSYENAPANFRSFRSVQGGEVGDAEPLTLRFSATTKLTKIESTKDFRVEQGSSCVVGNVYNAGGSCNLLVRFTPQGPGARLGKVTITHTASPTPMALGLGGYGYAPVLSFTPAQITTVPASYPANVGLLKSARNLTVDGGDTLYVADTGNNVVRSLDSSGSFLSLASGAPYTSPWGIAVDQMGQVYFDLVGSNSMYEIYDYGPVVQITGTTTGTCTASAPCTLGSHAVSSPGTMSMDRNNDLFFADGDLGAALSTVQPVPANLIYLYDPFPYQTSPSSPIVVDSDDNIYSFWSNGGTCSIMQSSLYSAENSKTDFVKVAGGHTCGFSGDGGQAGNAEIGASLGQMAFDLAGDLYFTDTKNNRVRRIDAVTGQINTIAGSGLAGYAGDSAAATAAQVGSPTGLAVDSQGQVYVISSTTATGTAQVIRKLGTAGFLTFGGQLKSTASAAKTVTLTNTGNSTMTLTNAVITGPQATEFTIDPATTSCLLTPGSTLASGQSCKVGILFKPLATGTRGANLVFLDNTVTGTNNVQLTGAGTLPTATVAITAPVAGSSFVSGTSIKFTTTVTYTIAPAPTGTVKFTLDGTVINNGVTLASGSASLNAVVSAVGSHTLSVTYSGDSNYSAPGAVTRTFTVTAAAVKKTATVKLSAANPTASCKTVSFATTVAGPDAVKPTGTVTLKEGTKVLGSATLTAGAATLKLTGLTVGTHAVTASYSGDATHAGATSAAFKESVTASTSCMTGSPKPVMPREPFGLQLK
jgi:sugar lactone lactonase YvrE